MSIRVFGITGTNGKTTSSYMLRNIILKSGQSAAMVGTIVHNTGSRVYKAINTTPSKQLMRQYFAEMKAKNIENLVMEVSSHGIAQGRTAETEFDYGAFTNLSRDHLDYHKDMEEYFDIKASFISSVKRGAVVNIDDEYGRRLWHRLTLEIGSEQERSNKKLLSFSMKDRYADLYANVESETLDGTEAQFLLRGKSLGRVCIRMAGRHSVYNALTAAGLGIIADESEGRSVFKENISEGLASLYGVPGRFEVIKGKEYKPTVVVDYAHTPDALENLLSEVRRLTKGKVVTVFGCGGNRDKGKRSLMGKVAGKLSDYCIITNDNPRQEDPLSIIKEIEKGIKETKCNYSILPDRYQAICRGIFISGRHDTVVVAGKGHEIEPFSDRVVCEELL